MCTATPHSATIIRRAEAEATQTHAHLAGHTGGAALVVAAFGSAALST